MLLDSLNGIYWQYTKRAHEERERAAGNMPTAAGRMPALPQQRV